MNTEKFNVPFFGKQEEIYLTTANYADNGNLSVRSICAEGPFASISTNIVGALSKEDGKDHICLDHNLPHEVARVLEEKGYITPTGRSVTSGFVQFHIYKVDLTKFH